MEAAPYLLVGSSVLSAANQYGAGKSAVAEGQAIKAAKEAEAAQMLVNAGQARATSQRKAMGEQKRTKYVQSALQARAAASGGGALDPTIMDITGDIAAEGDYRRRAALYEGDDATRVYNNAAALKRWEGDQAVRAGQIKRNSANTSAAGTLLGGFAQATAFGKWGEPFGGTGAYGDILGTNSVGVPGNSGPWMNPDAYGSQTYNQFGYAGNY